MMYLVRQPDKGPEHVYELDGREVVWEGSNWANRNGRIGVQPVRTKAWRYDNHGHKGWAAITRAPTIGAMLIESAKYGMGSA